MCISDILLSVDIEHNMYGNDDKCETACISDLLLSVDIEHYKYGNDDKCKYNGD